MKKIAFMFVIAAVLSAPAEARVHIAHPAAAVAKATAATAATAVAMAARAYYYGYYAPGVVVYGGPYGYPAVPYGW